ncbi:MAG TPA: hypothetical protein VH593_31670, partial [Ktedonobacteraceae bacterium]
IKHADVYHSETPSDFERWQMAGMTSTPLKQDEDEKQQKSKQKSGKESKDGDWNHDQPKGPAAEAIMLYLGGSRSHPIALVDDRRVRPYKVPEGASAFYAVSGTGQMLYHNDDGSHLVVTDNPKYGKNQKEKERYASIRHVKKKPQERKIGQGQSGSGSGSGGASGSGAVASFADVDTLAASGGSSGGGGKEPYKHEGEEVLTEIRATKNKVEIRDGDTVVGVYNKEEKSWTFQNYKKLNLSPSEDFTISTKTINMTASEVFNINGKPVNVNGGGPTIPPFTVPG